MLWIWDHIEKLGALLGVPGLLVSVYFAIRLESHFRTPMPTTTENTRTSMTFPAHNWRVITAIGFVAAFSLWLSYYIVVTPSVGPIGPQGVAGSVGPPGIQGPAGPAGKPADESAIEKRFSVLATNIETIKSNMLALNRLAVLPSCVARISNANNDVQAKADLANRNLQELSSISDERVIDFYNSLRKLQEIAIICYPDTKIDLASQPPSEELNHKVPGEPEPSSPYLTLTFRSIYHRALHAATFANSMKTRTANEIRTIQERLEGTPRERP